MTHGRGIALDAGALPQHRFTLLQMAPPDICYIFGMANRNNFGRLVLFIVLGLIIGGVLGEALGLLFGELGELMNAGGYDNIVRNFFVASFDLNLGFPGDKAQPVILDLYLIKLALGFGLKINVVSVIGMIISIYIMKWSGGNR